MDILLELNRLGEIVSGDYTGYYVKIIDDREGETGGFYINIFQNIDESGQAYDAWVETSESVRQYFEESHWQLKWL